MPDLPVNPLHSFREVQPESTWGRLPGSWLIATALHLPIRMGQTVVFASIPLLRDADGRASRQLQWRDRTGFAPDFLLSRVFRKPPPTCFDGNTGARVTDRCWLECSVVNTDNLARQAVAVQPNQLTVTVGTAKTPSALGGRGVFAGVRSVRPVLTRRGRRDGRRYKAGGGAARIR